MTRFRWMLLLLVALALPAHADDVVYPPGSRLGLVPPPGLHASNNATLLSRSSNPGKLVLACSPGGGTKPRREPGG